MQIDTSNGPLIGPVKKAKRISRRESRNFVSLLVSWASGIALLACMEVSLSQTQPQTAAELGGGEVQVAVNGQDDAERQAAYRLGLRILLQRFASRSANPAIANSEYAQEALRSAENLVDAFEYARIADRAAAGSIPVTRKVRDSGEATHILTVQYSSAALDQLLSDSANENSPDAGQTSNTTTANRARQVREALLWIMVQDDAAEIMIGSETAPAVVGRIRELAGGVGWVSGFPSLDVIDLAAVGPETLEALDQPSQELLRQAAGRYRFPRLLAGTVARQREGNWKLSLLSLDALTDKSEASDDSSEPSATKIELQAETLDAALQLVVAWMSGGLNGGGDQSPDTDLTTGTAALGTSGAQSSFGSSAAGARIWFSGVVGGGDYARIAGFLENLPSVTSSRMIELRPGGLLFQIEPRSALAAASAELQGEQWLQLSSKPRSVAPETDSSIGSASGSTTALNSNVASNSAAASTSGAPARDTAASNDSPEADLYLRYIR